MKRNHIIAGAAVLGVIAVAVLVWLLWPSAPPSVTGAPPGGVAAGNGEHTLGSPNAPIQIIEYGAPVCPVCARFDMDVFPLLKAQYIDTGKVYYIFRLMPIHPADIAAEGIARCLPKDQYFHFIDLLWRNQPRWDPEYEVPDVHAGLVEMSRIVGLSPQQVDTCIANPQTRIDVEKQTTEASAKYPIKGIPAFVVDGELAHSGYYPWDKFKALLDSKLAARK